MIITALIGFSYVSSVQFGTDQPQWRERGGKKGGIAAVELNRIILWKRLRFYQNGKNGHLTRTVA